MWKIDHPPRPPQSSIIERGPVRLSIAPTDNGNKQWQHLLLSLGRHSEKDHDECLKTWPREAIAMAREWLNRFEESLDDEGD